MSDDGRGGDYELDTTAGDVVDASGAAAGVLERGGRGAGVGVGSRRRGECEGRGGSGEQGAWVFGGFEGLLVAGV